MHGHNYKVEVFVEGEKNQHGMLIDFNFLKAIINRYDHITLNDVIEQPTVENIVSHILRDLHSYEDGENISTITLRIWEDSESYAEETWKRVE